MSNLDMLVEVTGIAYGDDIDNFGEMLGFSATAKYAVMGTKVKIPLLVSLTPETIIFDDIVIEPDRLVRLHGTILGLSVVVNHDTEVASAELIVIANQIS